MKAILMSDHAKWCALMMNGIKKIEVRKGTALYKATQKLIDEYGFAEFYVYCTKDEELFYDPKTKKWLTMKNRRNCPRLSNGMVVFKFRCYKVEEIEGYYDKDSGDNIYLTEELNEYDFLDKTQLKQYELDNYFSSCDDDVVGTAIHISDLEIFDKPKELSEFSTIVRPYKPTYRLTKAPQSFMYIEVGE